MNKSIHFIQVANPTDKLNCICQTIQKHFALRDRIMISVSSSEAAQYIDHLLWRQPLESFIPHAIANKPTEEHIVITTETKNLNQAAVLFALRTDVIPNLHEFLTIYDLMDLTHPAKAEASHKRLSSYREREYVVVMA